jgi:hypothetical protein
MVGTGQERGEGDEGVCLQEAIRRRDRRVGWVSVSLRDRNVALGVSFQGPCDVPM